jgi:PEP-CTERM motif
MSSASFRIGMAAVSFSLVTMCSLPAHASTTGFSAGASVQAGELVSPGFAEICLPSTGGSGFATASTSGTLGFTQTGTTAFGLPFGLFDCGGGGGQTIGFGSASADLPSGSLRAFSSAQGPFGDALSFAPQSPNPIEVKAGAGFSDTLTFSVPAAVAASNPDLVFSVMMTVTGSLSGVSQVTACDGANCMTQSNGPGQLGGPVNLQIPQFYSISDGSVVVLNAGLSVQSIGGFGGLSGVLFSSADFGDTAAITFELPAGVTFTSASGEFLSQPLGATPEPGSLFLLGTGLASMAGLIRRRLCW